MDIYSHMAIYMFKKKIYIYMFLAEKLTFVYIFKILRREKIQFDVGGSDLSWDGIPIIQQVASGSPTAQTTFNFSVSTATHKTKQTNKQTNKTKQTNKQTNKQTQSQTNKHFRCPNTCPCSFLVLYFVRRGFKQTDNTTKQTICS